MNLDEKWNDNLARLVKFFEENKRRPNEKSKNVDEKFIGGGLLRK